MPQFPCPKCFAPLSVSFEHAGRMVRCPKCRSIVPSPRPGGPLVEIPDATEEPIRVRIDKPMHEKPQYLPAETGSVLPDLFDEGESERRQQGRMMLFVSLGIVGTFAAGLILIVVIAVSNNNEQSKAPPVVIAQAVPRPSPPRPQLPVKTQLPTGRREQPAAPPRPETPNPVIVVIERDFIPDMDASPERPAGQRRDALKNVAPLPDDNEPRGEIPGKLMKELVPGYETRLIYGFTVLLSTQAVSEGNKDNGRPFKAMKVEFDGLAEVLSPAALKVLRRVPIWIEWDRHEGTGFRQRSVLAKYYGGNIWTPTAAEHLKANCVELLSLRTLAVEKGRTINRTRLVLLHELAHAVHYLLLGYDHEGVRFAYRLAMERNLYSSVQTQTGMKERAYAATNEMEYFAELTCAYLDVCGYFPFDRDDLREHDPTGYQLMTRVWGKPNAAAKTKAAP